MKRILTVTLNPAIDYTVDVPGFRTDFVNRADRGRRDPGGKGINVATITSRYRIDTSATGFLGRGNSLIFTDHFKRNSIEDRFVYVDGNTREGIKITDPVNRLTTDINFPGFDIHPEEMKEFTEGFGMIAPLYDYVLMSGSLPGGVPADIYAHLAVLAGPDTFVAVDTVGDALRLAAESGAVNLIKPNSRELLEAFPGTAASPGEICRKLLSKVEMIALSMGEDGSLLYTAEGCFRATAPAVKAASTVGAGDSFLGGLVSGFALGRGIKDSLRLAAATAAAKLTVYGPGWSDENPPGAFFESVEISSCN